jgi:hypothetical protein
VKMLILGSGEREPLVLFAVKVYRVSIR